LDNRLEAVGAVDDKDGNIATLARHLVVEVGTDYHSIHSIADWKKRLLVEIAAAVVVRIGHGKEESDHNLVSL
jgi:hypothetical protein